MMVITTVLVEASDTLEGYPVALYPTKNLQSEFSGPDALMLHVVLHVTPPLRFARHDVLVYPIWFLSLV
jgi:hypothetical protein